MDEGKILTLHPEGSIPWHVTTVKLDLEARRVIERVPGPGEHKLTLKR